MKKTIEANLPLAEAISKLLAPFAEVVLHDLESDSVAAIFNPLSRREVGDDSCLERMDLDCAEDVIGPYEKVNWDGRKLKCVSVVLKKGKVAEGLMCINIDISQFASAHALLSNFLNLDAHISDEKLFKEDPFEQINAFITAYCEERNLVVSSLPRDEKVELIKALNEEGAFSIKNAASYIARILEVSRATVYNYLGEE